MKFFCGFLPREAKAIWKQDKLIRKLYKYEKEFKEETLSVDNPYPDRIWTMWMQGYDQAPEIVKACIDSIKKFSNGREVVILDSNNINDYVQMPDYITKKYKEGKITHTHYSDLVRLELLDKYGGTWIDSTMYCTDYFEIFLKPDLMFFQKLRTDNMYRMSSFFMHSANPHNYLIQRLKGCLWNYWKKNNKLCAYFLLHLFFIVLLRKDEKCKQIWQNMPMFMSWLPQILVQEYTKEYNEERIEYLKSLCPVHKFSYKKDGFYSGVKVDEKYISENSLYNRIVAPYKKHEG